MAMMGPEIIRATMTRSRMYGTGTAARLWQYHSRSDYHSKVTAVALMIDLMRESPELRAGISGGLVGYGVNPKMRDRTNREKTLDVRFGVVDDALPIRGARSLGRLIEDLGIVLNADQWSAFRELPTVREAMSKQDLVVLENKACMTAHSKAAPRLRNELEGAVDAINNSDMRTVAGGLVLINGADTFVSPVWRDNGYVDVDQRRLSHHGQPEDAYRAAEKLRNIPMRRSPEVMGYDALGIVVVSAVNNGEEWELIEDPSYGAPQPADIWHYTKVVQRAATLYRQRFVGLW